MGALQEERTPTSRLLSSKDGLSVHPSGGNRRATSNSHVLQAPGHGAATSCLQDLGNLPSCKKTNVRNVSCHFRSPSAMELPPSHMGEITFPSQQQSKRHRSSSGSQSKLLSDFCYILIIDFKKCKALPSLLTYFLCI